MPGVDEVVATAAISAVATLVAAVVVVEAGDGLPMLTVPPPGPVIIAVAPAPAALDCVIAKLPLPVAAGSVTNGELLLLAVLPRRFPAVPALAPCSACAEPCDVCGVCDDVLVGDRFPTVLVVAAAVAGAGGLTNVLSAEGLLELFRFARPAPIQSNNEILVKQ